MGVNETYDFGNCLTGSEYMKFFFNEINGKPVIKIKEEVNLQKTCRELIMYQIINSAHDCSDGGLSVAIAESCINGNIGTTINEDLPVNWHKALFGETQSRIIVSTTKNKRQDLEEIVLKNNIPYKEIGFVGGEDLIFGKNFKIPLNIIIKHYDNGLQKSLSD